MVELEAQDLYEEMTVAYSILSQELDRPPAYIRATNGPAYAELYYDRNSNPSSVDIGYKLTETPSYEEIDRIIKPFKDNLSTKIHITSEDLPIIDQISISAVKNDQSVHPYINVQCMPHLYDTNQVKSDFKEVMDMFGAKYRVENGKIETKTEQWIPDTDLAQTVYSIFETFSKKEPQPYLNVEWSIFKSVNWTRPDGTEVIDNFHHYSVSLSSLKGKDMLSIKVEPRSIPEENSYGLVKEDVITAIDALLNFGCDFGDDWEIYSSEDDPRFKD